MSDEDDGRGCEPDFIESAARQVKESGRKDHEKDRLQF
jgi:hypothetical protein